MHRTIKIILPKKQKQKQKEQNKKNKQKTIDK